ncbi:butyrophilin subfamily 2 member A2-like isoform X2 [Micropterus dolomieu]|uniref:butyrophilin subfamily 2 member A2-like isoform X2 n=1 Tax=Micropterus dolomieu TaxID=147949 RepID=UPI001E8CC35F|nr:butyrophilin subfamily 2 member A2-like isoform X2 [Micropterus dolomieu]
MKVISSWSQGSTMGSLIMYIVVALGASCSAAPVSGSLVVLVQSPVTVHHGHKTTLPCWLNPPQSAEGFEVRWYRHNNFDFPAMLYRAKKFDDTSQEASYKGRVSFGLKDAASGGRKEGDVSLQLVNATLEDAGDYVCYVSSDQGYDSESVSLIVTERGAPPLLSAVWKEDNVMNVSCESGGWYPEPILSWSDQKQVLDTKNLNYRKESSGLVSVHSWLLVASSSEVYCSVGLSGEEMKEAGVRLENPPQPGEQGSSAAGWVAFTLAMLVLAVLGVLYFIKRRKKANSRNDHPDGKKSKSETDHAGELQKPLLEEVILSPDLSTARKYYVNVTLDKKENQYLKIKNNILRDAYLGGADFPDGQKVTCLTAIKGTPGFSSGQHYWEVSMGRPSTVFKQSWWVGVTSATVFPLDADMSPTPSNGFWFLSSSPDRADRFQFNTEPNVFLPVHFRLQTVGVYLDYDGGELSFYNVEDKSLIGSLTAKFTREVFPLFNPGKGDKAAMEIIQRTEQAQCSDTGNCIDSPAQEPE